MGLIAPVRCDAKVRGAGFLSRLGWLDIIHVIKRGQMSSRLEMEKFSFAFRHLTHYAGSEITALNEGTIYLHPSF